MAQLFNSRNVWEEPVREAAEDARRQADLMDEARARGLVPEGEPYGGCYDVTIRGSVEQVVALAGWAAAQHISVNEVAVGPDEDWEMAVRELGDVVIVADL